MKKIILIGILFLMSAPLLQATTVVVNFDSLSGSGLVPSPYGGINWLDNWSYYDSVQDPYNPASPPERIYTNYDKFLSGSLMED